jgi:uncharacterized lipoprotein YehR (DUF1307 family)
MGVNKTYRPKMRYWKHWVIGLLLAGMLTGCGSSKSDSLSSSGAAAVAPQMQELAMESANFMSADQSGKEIADTKTTAKSAANGAVMDKASSSAPASASSGVQAAQSLAAAGPVPSAPVDGFDRKLIYKANVTMEVESYDRTQSEVRGSIVAAGGYILQFSEYNSKAEKGGTFVIKVPSSGFFGMIDALEAMKPISLNRNMQGSDVTEEYVDLESRLKAKQMTEARLLDFMEKATKADELVSFSNELGRIQEDIEKLKGRMRYLDQNVAFSTIELRMFEKLKGESASNDDKPDSVMKRAGEAMKKSGEVLSSVFAGLLVFVAGALPVLVVLAILLIPAYFIYRRLNHKKPPVNKNHSSLTSNRQDHNPDE